MRQLREKKTTRSQKETARTRTVQSMQGPLLQAKGLDPACRGGSDGQDLCRPVSKTKEKNLVTLSVRDLHRNELWRLSNALSFSMDELPEDPYQLLTAVIPEAGVFLERDTL